jgi:hypothetical protein
MKAPRDRPKSERSKAHVDAGLKPGQSIGIAAAKENNAS